MPELFCGHFSGDGEAPLCQESSGLGCRKAQRAKRTTSWGEWLVTELPPTSGPWASPEQAGPQISGHNSGRRDSTYREGIWWPHARRLLLWQEPWDTCIHTRHPFHSRQKCGRRFDIDRNGSGIGRSQRNSPENPLIVQTEKLRWAMVKQVTDPKAGSQVTTQQNSELRFPACQTTPIRLVADFQSRRHSGQGPRHTRHQQTTHGFMRHHFRMASSKLLSSNSDCPSRL